MALARGSVLLQYVFTFQGTEYVFRATDNAHAFRHCRKIINREMIYALHSCRFEEFNSSSAELRGIDGIIYASTVRGFYFTKSLDFKDI